MKIKLAFAAALAATASAATAYADEPGYYFGIGGGVSAPVSTRVLLTRPINTPEIVRTTFAPGWAGQAEVGYKSANGERYELEVGYRQSNFLHMDAGTATGHQSVMSAMGNALYDFSTGSAISPYLGAGLGMARVKWTQVQATTSPTLPGALPVFDDTSHPVFQYQVIAGVSYAAAKAASVFLEYSYVGMTESQFESTALPGASFSGVHPATHNLMAGVRISFGGR